MARTKRSQRSQDISPSQAPDPAEQPTDPNEIFNSLGDETFFVYYETNTAKISIEDDGSFTLRTPKNNDHDALFASSSRDNSGSASMSSILNEFDSNDDMDGFKRMYLNYRDSSLNYHEDIVSIDTHPTISANGNFVYKGKILPDSDEVGIITTTKKWGKFSDESNFITSELNGNAGASSEAIDEVVLFMDNHTNKELKQVQSSIKDEFGSGSSSSAKVKYRFLDDDSSSSFSGNGDPSKRSFQLVDQSYNFDRSSASLGFDFSVEPDFNASITRPRPRWWQYYQYFQPSRYSVNLDAGLTWNAGAEFDPGSESNGSFTLASRTFDGPRANVPIYGPFVTAYLDSDLTLSASLDVPALNSENYRFDFSQRFGFNMTGTTGGMQFRNTSDPKISATYPSIDKLTGVSFNANATPAVHLGLAVGAKLPLFGNKNLAQGQVTASMPVDLDLAVDLGRAPDLEISMSGKLSASSTLFGFLFGGLEYSTPEYNLFGPISTGNLLA